jgi:hypothetical protein
VETRREIGIGSEAHGNADRRQICFVPTARLEIGKLAKF